MGDTMSLQTSMAPTPLKASSMSSDFKAVFNGNLKKISEVELLLYKRRTQVVELAEEFMMFIAVIEHPMNDFTSVDPAIYDNFMKPNVIDVVRKEVQQSFVDVEQSF